MGRTNPACDYSLNGQVLVKVNSERDIGVQVSGDLKVSEQCAKGARTAMGVLVQILRAFSYQDKRVLPRLYVQYVSIWTLQCKPGDHGKEEILTACRRSRERW